MRLKTNETEDDWKTIRITQLNGIKLDYPFETAFPPEGFTNMIEYQIFLGNIVTKCGLPSGSTILFQQGKRKPITFNHLLTGDINIVHEADKGRQ